MSMPAQACYFLKRAWRNLTARPYLFPADGPRQYRRDEVHAVSSSTSGGITITPRHPLIGAEIRGVDLGRVHDDTFRRIYEAWLVHLLLVFSEQDVTDEQQIAFARRFGELEIHPSSEHRSSRHPEIYRVSNVDERGNIMPQESKSWRYMNLTWLWHTDSSFREVPSMGSILHGIEVPAEGGDTLFANMHAVYEALSDKMRERIRGMRVLHSHDQVLSHDPNLKNASEDYTRLPAVHHPLVRRHPVTGRLSLSQPPYHGAGRGPDGGGRPQAAQRTGRLRYAGLLRLSPQMEKERRHLLGQSLHDACGHALRRRQSPSRHAPDHDRGGWPGHRGLKARCPKRLRHDAQECHWA
jgi:alpha-ketoglutarate-dependent taurine dioxygenase